MEDAAGMQVERNADLRTALEALPAAPMGAAEEVAVAAGMTERMTLAAAIVSEAFRRVGLTATLVGGGVIAMHLPGAYVTSDIDLVVESRSGIAPSRESLGAVFASLGFEKRGGRHWIRGDLLVEVPGSDLTDPVDTVMIAGFTLRTVRIESLLVGRLVEFDQTGHTGHGAQAFVILSVLRSSLDEALLAELARRERVVDLLAALREIAEGEDADDRIDDAALVALRERVRAERRGRS